MADLTLFAIPKGFTDPHISLIQRNALASWQRLAPAVEILLIGHDPGVEEAARNYGATHIRDAEQNELGTPLLDSAFREAAVRASGSLLCYVNADIVLLDDFLAAARRLPAEAYLAIGRRWDCDVTSPLDFSQGDAALRDWAQRDGKLDLGRGSDYFVFRRESDFGLPPFAVGRPGWDNWMIRRALQLGFPVIDMTESVTAIHQNHGYGHVANAIGSDWEGPEAKRNRDLAGDFDRYIYTPYNATHLLGVNGLRRARSRKHVRARIEAFIALNPGARPLHRLIRLLHRSR
ncbi:MAG: hypothetical protein ABSC56_12125 [Solirubrobacteraceae bacterium]|jgi:hypothetical protein